MKVLYIFDEDDKFGAPRTGIDLILDLKKKYNIYPIVITSKYTKINEICNDNKIENYVTHHHKYTYVFKFNPIFLLKVIPRFIRYRIGNIMAMHILKKNIDFSQIDLIHTNISGIDLGPIIGKKYNIKNVMHIREFGDLDFKMKSYRLNQIKFLNKNVDYFISISDAIRNKWIQKGVKENKIFTIYNGLSIVTNSNNNFRNAKEKYNAVIVGSICEGKGQLQLIDAFSKLPKQYLDKIHLDIVGSGYKTDVKKLRKMIVQKKLSDNINYIGFDSDISSKLGKYDIGFVCSNAEGFGRVTIEYLSNNLCVVASDTGANPEILNEENGLLYKKSDTCDLCNKIQFLLSNPDQFEKYSKNSIINLNKYSIDNFSNNIFNFYIRILGRDSNERV